MAWFTSNKPTLRGNTVRWLALSVVAVSMSAANLMTVDSALASTHPTVAQRLQVEGNLYEIAFDPQRHQLYAATIGNKIVAANGSQREVKPGILVMDGDTLSVIRRIETGDVSPFGLAINAETRKLYTTDTLGGAVAVYDIDDGERTALIHAPEGQASHVRQVVVDPVRDKIYVSVVGGFSRGDEQAPPSAIWVIDGETDTLAQVIDNPVQIATGLALDATNQRLYVADMANSEVAEIDLDDGEVLRTFSAQPPAKTGPHAPSVEEGAGTINLELDAKRGLLYAVNQKAGGVAVIDLDSGEIVDDIQTGAGALSAKLNPRTGDLFVANRGDGTIAVVDGDTRQVSAYLPGGTYPQTVAIAPERGDVYVSNKAKGRGRGAADDVPTPFEPGGNTVIRIEP
ncbi:YncE family protein [Salinicola acroporae]|uniref:SMP-30/Gluconolactonase/LRE-like region domain-containing protein n=1 Tax=Salinicola acroporae TaxID=1541440 RepID=A0ABT6I5I0_9GAMM|nr:YncE family protein [Salinicola acroporae]MDH4572540.1 hypothetical protein [Salinicola acroporae]